MSQIYRSKRTGISMAAFTNKAEILASLEGMEDDIQNAVVEKLKETVSRTSRELRDSIPSAQVGADLSSKDISGVIRSAPGALPFSQTGELKKAITSKVLPPLLGKPITAVVYVGTDGFYGRMLEFGTSKMAARPWFYPFLLRQNPEMRGAILAGLEKEIKRRQGMRGRYLRRGRMDKAQTESFYKRDVVYMESL